MRKQRKKLTLARETVRGLEAPGLRTIRGATAFTYLSNCCLTYYCVTTNGPYECANACIGPEG